MLPFVFQTIYKLIAMHASVYFSTCGVAVFRFLHVLHEAIWVDVFAVKFYYIASPHLCYHVIGNKSDTDCYMHAILYDHSLSYTGCRINSYSETQAISLLCHNGHHDCLDR